MERKRIYTSDEDAQLLRRMAEWFRKEVVPTAAGEEYRFTRSPETFIALVPAGGIPAMDETGTGYPVPGKTLCYLYYIQNDELYPVGSLRDYVYNYTGSEIGAGYILVTRLRSGQWVPAVGGTYFKHMGTFELTEALTVSDEQAWGVMIAEWGEGSSHSAHGVETGTGTGTGTGTTDYVVLHNFETHTAGSYEFYADSGDRVIAYYDKYEDGVEHWNIVIPECP